MEKRDLGKTGIQVSEIAFGGVEIGIPYGIGVTKAEDMLSKKDAIHLLHTALDSGMNFFDTARMYGESENIMGAAFRDRRKEVVICTKCRHLRDQNGKLPDAATLLSIIEKSLEESLQALQTDYVDVLMLHQADLEILENETIANAFLQKKAAGIIRAMGVSTYTVEETAKAIGTGVWDVIQLPFNLMDQRHETLFHTAQQQGVGLVVRSVLLKGLLSDRGKNLHPALQNVEKHIEQYQQLTDQTALDLPTLATRFALSFGAISAVLVGIDKLSYLHQALAAANGKYLSESELLKATQLAYPDPEFLNLPHWDRMGWLT